MFVGSAHWLVLACLGLVACGNTAADAPVRAGAASGGAPGGAGGDAGAQAAQPALALIPPISGLWTLFGWEDPVTVELHGAGGAGTAQLSGRGCFDGPYHLLGGSSDRQSSFSEAEACSSLSGTAVGNHFKFELTDLDQPPSLGGLHSAAYAFDVYASSAADRMSGALNVLLDAVPEQPVADFGWLPLDRLAYPDISPPGPARDLAPLQDGASYALKLRDAGALGDLAPKQIYRAYLQKSGGRFHLVGNLGAYFDDELSYDAVAHRLTAGPVSATRPQHIVALSVQYANDDVTQLEATATTADGDSATLVPVPLQP